MTRGWKILIFVTVVLASAALVLGPVLFALLANERRARAVASAKSQLQNCLQNELIKGQIRATIGDSAKQVKRLPEPQRGEAESQIATVLKRFKAQNCYLLPIVKSEGIKKPPARRTGLLPNSASTVASTAPRSTSSAPVRRVTPGEPTVTRSVTTGPPTPRPPPPTLTQPAPPTPPPTSPEPEPPPSASPPVDLTAPLPLALCVDMLVGINCLS